MQNFNKILITLTILTIFLTPLYIFAQEKTLIPCGVEKTEVVTDENGKSTGGEIINPCEYQHVFELVNNVADFILKNLAVPIAAIGIFYAGILMIFSGGNDEGKTKAKKIFTGVALGLIFVAGSWLIVKTILVLTGYKYIGEIF